MSFRRWVARLDLVAVLLVVTIVELALNRLAVHVLRPVGPMPSWHRHLDFAALFTFHLASILALAVGLWTMIDIVRRDDLFVWPARVTIVIVGQVFFLLAAWSVFAQAPQSLSFHLETAFIVVLLLIWFALLIIPGDTLVKAGLLILIVPFLLHYYSTFALRFLADDAARASIPERVREWGQLWIAIGVVAVQVCFAPRPWQRYALRLGPLVLAGFVGTVAAVVMRRHYDVGMELASRGLGIELGPAAPTGIVAAFVLAAAATAWTLASTLTADSPARRRIGIGFALIVCGGYAFAWPLQFLCAVVGALAIAQGGARVRAEESAESAPSPAPRRGPMIGDAVWRAYVTALSNAIGGSQPRSIPRGPIEETSIGGVHGTTPFAISIQRTAHGVASIDMIFGIPPPADEPPSLTLLARPEGALYAPHPAPPASDAPAARTSDSAFDRRFRAQDRGGLLARCFDDSLRARATALLDGWIAVWPGRALRYRVHPGRGAPIDHPIPAPSLALGVEDVGSTTERLVRVFDLLLEIAERALASSEPSETVTS